MKRMICVLLILLLALLPVASGLADLFTVSYATYDTTYDAILKMYIRVLNANGDDGRRHDLFNDLIYNDFHHDAERPMPERMAEAKQRVGYCIADLNQDGIDELIIGENYAYVNEVFTLDNGKVRELIRAGGKYSCSLLSGGYFYRHTRDGGALASSTVWKMNGTSGVIFDEGYRMDNEFGASYQPGNYISHEYQWFRMKNGEDYTARNETLVSVDEYQSWLRQQDQKLLPLRFIPFAVYEQGIDLENAGIISVKGKTNGRDQVRIRSAAKKNSKVVKNEKTGTYVNILGEENDYYKISYGKITGYIQKDFLTKVSDDASSGGHHIYDSRNEAYMKKAEEEAIMRIENRNPVPSPAPASSEPSVPEPVVTENPTEEDDQEDFELVVDYYQEVEVQKSRTVNDVEYILEDNGEGQYVEVPHEITRTEYYTEVEQVPVYKKVPKK